MKTVIKFVILGVVLYAVGQAALVAGSYYRFRATAQQLITFGLQVSTTDLHNQILFTGLEFKLPLTSEDISVERQGPRTVASARYVQDYEYFPNNFYPVELSFRVEAFAIASGLVVGTP
jgi:hypothetical protein